jgi:hypothetical protein
LRAKLAVLNESLSILIEIINAYPLLKKAPEKIGRRARKKLINLNPKNAT